MRVYLSLAFNRAEDTLINYYKVSIGAVIVLQVRKRLLVKVVNSNMLGREVGRECYGRGEVVGRSEVDVRG